MFDYQAGERYKLTLIMVGLAGLLAGIFFSVLLMPSPDTSARSRRPQQSARYLSDPDVTGYRPHPGAAVAASSPGSASPAHVLVVDPLQAHAMIQQFLPLAWDLSAATAHDSQARAIQFMTPECAQSYRQNIWTDAIAAQIQQSGLQSTFVPGKVDVGGLQADGTIVVSVEGVQTLTVPGKGGKSRNVKVEYLMKQFPEGLKIAGISEAGQR